ncbi:hypothetical protein CYMTET_19176 [Cymbomonas tetramitiformis]|uniref:Uncharacterized protein n=1 Tax=Cymbomonas tetramitiformis TaxID=36881 RepID=A0AAE0L586_9CHLO|nr:hypothetical protein CYMTET_19176 [Cymbomonas tetramitiformis]
MEEREELRAEEGGNGQSGGGDGGSGGEEGAGRLGGWERGRRRRHGRGLGGFGWGAKPPREGGLKWANELAQEEGVGMGRQGKEAGKGGGRVAVGEAGPGRAATWSNRKWWDTEGSSRLMRHRRPHISLWQLRATWVTPRGRPLRHAGGVVAVEDCG